MSPAVAAKPEEKKSKAAARTPGQCEGQQMDANAGASAGLPLFLGGGCGCPDCEARVQAKLVVGQAGDLYEQQADRVAGRASSGGVPRWSSRPRSTPSRAVSSNTRIQTADSGSPLDPAIRERAEPSLGADLSHVRVHSSSPDREVARRLGAQAFTHGSHIWLGPTQSSSDVKLLAHEATHVVQQGAAPGKTPAVQRQEGEADSPPQPAERGRPDTGPFREMLRELPPAPAPGSKEAAEAAAAAKERERPDPAKLASKKAELRAKGQPAVNRANRDQPRLQKAAQGAKSEAHKPPTPKERKGSAAGGKSAGRKSGGKRAAGHRGGISMGLQKPSAPPQVQPPKIAAPVDAAGKPLAPDPTGDAGIVKLIVMAQAMRLKGFMLRERAAQERHNAGVIQHNLGKVEEGIGQAEEGIGKSQEHLSYRREVTGQAEGAVHVSEQKAEMVATQAPKFQSTSAEGKAKSGPMSGEAKDLAAENASKAPDDDDAAEKSQEQGQKLGKVGSDIGSMDDAMTQTKAKADSLAGDAAQAKQKNAKTQQNIAGTHSALDKTGAKLTQLSGQNATAQAQAAAHTAGPARMAAAATALDQQGVAAIQASIVMEQRAHSAQQRYLDGMRSVPQSRRSQPVVAGGAPVLVQRQTEPGAAGKRIDLNLAGEAGEALPSWLTGEEKQTEEQRAEAQAAEKKRREAEIKEINDKAGGDFSKLTVADKAGIALSLTGRHLFGSVAGIKWPNFLGKLLQGLVDPRMALMGIVSGLSMVLSGAANLLSAEQWKKDPLGNLLKSAADIATGITIVLGAITALAMAIIAIMIAAAIFSFGLLGPLAAAVIPFCMTIVGTVGPWTMEAAAIALELNLLVMIKDLVDAATAETAEKLEDESDKVTEDAKNAGNMALQIGMAAVGEAGGEALASTKFGQGMAAGMRDIGEDFGIVKPAGASAPALPEGAAAEPVAPASGETTLEPKAEAAPNNAEPAPAAKAGAPSTAEPSPTPKAEAAPAEAPQEAAPESKAPEPAEGQPKPDDIAAEQPGAEGHKVKVTKEGECLICTECENANTVVHQQLEGSEVPPAEQARIEDDLETAQQIEDPAQKAEAVAEVHKEATEAAEKADVDRNDEETARDSRKETPSKAEEPVGPGHEPGPKTEELSAQPEEARASMDESSEPAEPETEASGKPKSKAAEAREKLAEPLHQKLAETREQIAELDAKVEELEAELHAAERQVEQLRGNAKAARGDAEAYAKAREDLAAAKEKLAEIKEGDELGGAREERSDLKKTEERLQNALREGTYDRPSFRSDTKPNVWDKAPKTANGGVVDPSGQEIMPGDDWVMGHKPGYEFWKHQQSAMERGLTREQFLEECNDSDTYRPELKPTNESHQYEAPDNYNLWAGKK